jgi:hypothetical protein
MVTPVFATLQLDGRPVVVEALVRVDDADDPQAAAERLLAASMPHAKLLRQSDANFRYAKTGLRFSSGQATYHYKPDEEPSFGTGIHEAADAWSNAGARFAFVAGGTTSRCPSLAQECPGGSHTDGHNDIAWLPLDSNFEGYTYWLVSSTHPEFDSVMNTDSSWGPGANDAHSMFMHELGHGLGLAHSNESDATMYPYVPARPSLHEDDIAGVIGIYGPAEPDVPAVCGDGIVSGDEACDGSELGGQTCEDLGFADGALGCSPMCELDTVACIDAAPEPGDTDGDPTDGGPDGDDPPGDPGDPCRSACLERWICDWIAWSSYESSDCADDEVCCVR